MFKVNHITYCNVFNINEVSHIINRSERTVREFIKAGLPTIDNKKPFLIRGYDLIEFLKNKNVKNSHKTQIDEMFCMACREVRTPANKTICIKPDNNIKLICASALCSVCGTVMNKSYKLDDLGKLKRIFHIAEKLSIHDSDNCPVNCQINDNDNEQGNGNNKNEQLYMPIS